MPTAANLNLAALTEDEVDELLALLHSKSEYEKYNKIETFTPYPYQTRFFEAGTKYKRRFLCAANRIGKTYSAAVEICYHLLQEYPDWWPGHKFDRPILLWAVGITGESTQKVLQKEIFGTENAKFEALVGTGSIPKSRIIDLTRDGPRVLMAKIKGKHGISTIEFRSTQQGFSWPCLNLFNCWNPNPY